MKKFFAPLLLLCAITSGYAQQPCATEMPAEMTNWLIDYKENSRGPYYSKNNDTTYLPIQFHIVGTDAGGGYYKFNTLLDALRTLNVQYAPYLWQFYMVGQVNYINSTALFDHTGSYQGLINSHSVTDVINIFFVRDPSGACGYYSSWGGPSNTSGGGRQGYIAINNSCGADENTTIAHELGHFFSLPHTFSGWESRSTADAPKSTDERVNGSNCATAGDRFCDTPADFISDRWNCPYSLTKTDFVGTPYSPDGSLYMSYANDNCQDHHSEEQLDAMRSYLADRRSGLLGHTFPQYPFIVDSSATIFPPANATGIPANYVNLKWKKIEGADYYIIEGLRSNNPNNLAFDTIISSGDTSMLLTDLDAGFTYRWRVRAFNNYSTHTPFTIYSFFSTSAPTSLNPVIDVEPVSCNGAFDGSISVSVNGGQGPYSFTWSNGGVNHDLTFLPNGNYLVTVTDDANQSLVLSIDIPEPAPLEVELVPNGNDLIAQTEGGTAPYTYAWSTGDTDAGVSTASGGSYSVTITDGNGCSAVKTYSTPVGINPIDAASSLRVYPNPTAGASSFAVEFTVPQALTATIEVVDNTGRRVYSVPQNFALGLNVTEIPVSQLSSGLYFVRIVSQEVVKTTKLLIY